MCARLFTRTAWFGTAVACLAFASSPALAHSQPHADRIEVAFVLDTTGSMSGLIDNARRKIWSIANTISRANPNADIRMGLVAYRDFGDDYVVRTFQMTPDLQEVNALLWKFRASGGGDGPEAVNEALDAGVSEIAWSRSGNTRRLLFLVGDAPPHMDYQGPNYPEILKEARQRDITVNTVQAGDWYETRQYWQTIARMGGGSYIAIAQDGGLTTHYDSPWDDEILDLQRRIDQTVVPYGNRAQQRQLQARIATKSYAKDHGAVAESSYLIGKGKVTTGDGDLVDDLEAGRVDLKTLPKDQLPEAVADLAEEEQRAFVAQKLAERRELSAQMKELVAKRDAHVADARKSEASAAPAFDTEVSRILEEQLN
ncbi:vWA domain-containing protein [Roseibium sp.]|uniref:vWA domain-containing protein n=1 Tax=Roseibium sp. TaxID=1936156 RepID=UPI003BAFD19E